MNISGKGNNLPVEQSPKVSNPVDSSNKQDIAKQLHTSAPTKPEREQISSLSKAVDSTFENLASKSDVDLDKVAKVKAAIANGDLSLDQDTLINALIEFHKK